MTTVKYIEWPENKAKSISAIELGVGGGGCFYVSISVAVIYLQFESKSHKFAQYVCGRNIGFKYVEY